MMDAPTGIWSHCLEYAVLSDVGNRRANNQDSSVAILADSQTDFEQRGHFFMVADGMGAHAAGELASKMATDAVALGYRKRRQQSPSDALLSAVRDANKTIHHRGQASPDFRGMGTTATALVLLPTGAIVAHVGDSRAYQLRGTRLEQLTFDHSLVWELRAANPSPDAELPSHISRNIITRSLGPAETVQVDLEGPYSVQVGDTFLLCSDGLSGQVKDDEIGAVLGSLPPADAAQTLVDLANVRGGPDNITVVVARVLGPQVAQKPAINSLHSYVPSGHASVHPLVWTLAGVSFLLGAGSLTLGNGFVAFCGFLGLMLALLLAIVQRCTGVRHPQWEVENQLGKGPYVTCSCEVHAEMLSRFQQMVEHLRDSATKEQWLVDWDRFNRLSAPIEAESKAGKLKDAVANSLRTISCMMGDLRKLRNTQKMGGETPESF